MDEEIAFLHNAEVCYRIGFAFDEFWIGWVLIFVRVHVGSDEGILVREHHLLPMNRDSRIKSFPTFVKEDYLGYKSERVAVWRSVHAFELWNS